MAEMYRNLGEFLTALRSRGDLCEVEAEVDPDLEIPEIHRRVIAAGGPALLFKNPKNSDFPLVTNLFGTQARVKLAFGDGPQELISEVASLPEELMPPTLGKLWQKRSVFQKLMRVGTKSSGRGSILDHCQSPPALDRLPALKTWSEDGGPFVTLPLVYTEHPETGGHNLGMYRMQIYNAQETGMHFQIGKGGGYHLAVAEAANKDLDLNVFLGGPPALMLSAIAPLPENVPELMLASLVMGKKLGLVKGQKGPLPLAAEAEFVMVGKVLANERRPEGPFGDHYGYYSLKHDYPVFSVQALHHRDGAIFPATVVGKPRQEDFFIGDYLQDLLSPLFPVVMPAVQDLWSYGETGYHSLAAAVVKQRYRREAMTSAFRILGEGQLALTKFLLVTDQTVDLRDFSATLAHVLERADFRTDLYVFANLSMDTLDYTGPKVNEGSKGVLLGLGDKKRSLPEEFSGPLPGALRKALVFCPGCLVVEGDPFASAEDLAARVAEMDELSAWPMIALVDNAAQAAKSDMNFLWTVFTRFEPAADLYAKASTIIRHHPSYSAPIVIDARMKPNYPDELFCDPDTAQRVDENWDRYFPAGMEMGDSGQAHLD